jgi:hypothetical protein
MPNSHTIDLTGINKRAANFRYDVWMPSVFFCLDVRTDLFLHIHMYCGGMDSAAW